MKRQETCGLVETTSGGGVGRLLGAFPPGALPAMPVRAMAERAIRAAARRPAGRDDAGRIVATLAVLLRLEDLGDGVPPAFAPVIRKAEEWLASATAGLEPPGDRADWRAWARATLG